MSHRRKVIFEVKLGCGMRKNKFLNFFLHSGEIKTKWVHELCEFLLKLKAHMK